MESTEPAPPRRVIVMGNTGSGKSTLAERIAERAGMPFVELDALFWRPHWTEPDAEEFRAAVAAATAGDAWAIAGNYVSRVQDVMWRRADAIVYLDYPLRTVLRRLIARTWRRARTRELLWGTNRESALRHLKLWDPTESLIAFAVRHHAAKRRSHRAHAADPRWAHVEFVWLRSPAETARWLDATYPAAVEGSASSPPGAGAPR